MKKLNKDDVEKKLDDLTLKEEKILIQMFDILRDRMSMLIVDLFEKYSKDGKVTYSDFTKYNRSMQFEKLAKNEIFGIFGQVNKSMLNNLILVYLKAYYYYYYLMEVGSQTEINMQTQTNSTSREVVLDKVAGFNYRDRLNKYSTMLFVAIKENIHSNISQDKELRYIREIITRVIDVQQSNILRLYNAENLRCRSRANEIIYNQAISQGVEFDKVWLATLDYKTRDRHRQLDNQVADKKGYFHIDGYKSLAPGMFGVASLDVNCRCTTIARFKDLEPKGRKENINDKQIIKYKSYKEWEKSKT
jgi:hypothetical protein